MNVENVEKRVINVKVDGYRVKKDSRVAGAQHEGNVTTMRFRFDASWECDSIEVVFWNAKGENPTSLQLYEPVDGDLSNTTRECLIPFEAMTEVGEASYSLIGTWLDADEVVKRQRTVEDFLEVLPAEDTTIVGNASNPTATDVDQVKAEMNLLAANVDELLSLNLTAVKGYAEAAHTDMEAADGHRGVAQNAALSAIAARDAIYNMSASAESVSADERASVTKSGDPEKNVTLHFKLPRGKSGVYVGSGLIPEGCNVQINPVASGGAVLTVYDADGNSIPIPAIKGEDGLDPYSYAFMRGYTKSEQEFVAAFLTAILTPPPFIQSFEVSVFEDDWEENGSGEWTNAVSVEGLTSSDDPIADVIAERDDQLVAWSSVKRILIEDGKATLISSEKPATDYQMRLKVVR